MDRVNEDLRHRLDQADADRRQALDRLAAAQERIAALLTDQRAAPPTLPSARGGLGGDDASQNPPLQPSSVFLQSLFAEHPGDSHIAYARLIS